MEPDFILKRDKLAQSRYSVHVRNKGGDNEQFWRSPKPIGNYSEFLLETRTLLQLDSYKYTNSYTLVVEFLIMLVGF